MANHIAVNPLPSSAFMFAMADFGPIVGESSFTPMIGLTIYDGLGESHARNNPSSAGGFSWLWDRTIKGGLKADMLSEGTYEDAINTQAYSGTEYGTMRFHLDNVTPFHEGSETDLGLLERCYKWYNTRVKTLGDIGRVTFFLFEPMHWLTYVHGVTDADTA
jgi:hypothetical protein